MINFVIKDGESNFSYDLIVVGSANRGDSLDRHIDEESSKTKDFLILVSNPAVLLL